MGTQKNMKYIKEHQRLLEDMRFDMGTELSTYIARLIYRNDDQEFLNFHNSQVIEDSHHEYIHFIDKLQKV